MKKRLDTLICADFEDAEYNMQVIGEEHVIDWDFLKDGTVKLYLDCRMEELDDSKK